MNYRTDKLTFTNTPRPGDAPGSRDRAVAEACYDPRERDKNTPYPYDTYPGQIFRTSGPGEVEFDLRQRDKNQCVSGAVNSVGYAGLNTGPGEETIKFDPVTKPAHYNHSGIECIQAIEASMSKEEFQGYLKGNVEKYVWRFRYKNGLEDLKKARWYLDKLISSVES